MEFKLLEGPLTPAEGEAVVRTYHTTSLSSGLLGLKAEGFLTVTNLRVVFYGFGSAFAGPSILHSEVPIADVSGITSYKGAYFSVIHLVKAGAVSFRTDMELIKLAPFILIALAAIFVWASTSMPRDKIQRSILATCGALMLAGIGGLGLVAASISRFLGGEDIYTFLGGLVFLLALATGIYALVCYVWYARRQTMALAVSSKSGSSTPIAISGIAGFGLFSGAALRSLTAEPAADAEKLIMELGALITDIQAMGVHGIQKWQAL